MNKTIINIITKLNLNFIINDFYAIFSKPNILYDELDYNKYWDNREDENNFQYRWPIMISEIKDNSSILDIGCGDGGFLRMLKNEHSKINEIGIDISEKGVQRAVAKGINAFTRSLDYYDNQNKLFDYVVISEVIEHVPNSEHFVLRGHELAKRKLIITNPKYWILCV